MLQAENLSFVYPDGRVALDGVDLTIASGEAVAIMGGNGAGKTTLVKHFNGLLQPTKGRVLVNGLDTRQRQAGDLAHTVGLVFQNPYQQLFAQTVIEEIALGLAANHRAPASTRRDVASLPVSLRVASMIQACHLDGLENRHPLSLSEGQKKRLALAAVLAMEPEVLILDEPTLGQDGREKAALREILVGVQARGGTVVLVTHDIDFACACCQRVVIMDRGRVLADGPAEEISRHTDVLRQAGLVPPQLVELAEMLRPWGLDAVGTSCERLAEEIVGALTDTAREQPSPLPTPSREREQASPRPSPSRERGESSPQPSRPGVTENGPTSQMDPRGKVVATVLLFAAVSVANHAVPVALIAVFLLAAIIVHRAIERYLGIAGMLLPVVSLVAGMDIIYFGPAHGLLVGFRFLLTVSLFAVFFLTTSLDDLSAALMSWRLPYPLVFALVTGARFAPTVALEAREIVDAYQARGLEGGRGPLAWLRRYQRLLVPLVAASIRRSLRLGEAMEMRGFGKTNRPTILRELQWGWGDTILLAAGAALLAISLAVRA